MNSRRKFALLLLLPLMVLGGWGVAQSASPRTGETGIPVALSAEGSSDDFWLAQTSVSADGSPMTSIRQRVDARSGKWEEIARLQDRVTAMAALGDRLAIATATDWRMVWQGGGAIGPPLPGNRVISRLAGDGDALWALAGAGGSGRELFRWNAANGWTQRGVLPLDAGALAGSMRVVNGLPWVAYLTAKNVCVDRADAAGWKRLAVLPMSPAFKLLNAGSTPLLAWRDAGGAWTIYDLSQQPAKIIRTIPSAGLSDVAIAATSLRVLTFDKDIVSQQLFDDFGRGAASGPDLIGQITPAIDRANEWPNFFLMGVLTAALVVGMRSRTLPAADVLAAAHIRVAPLGRRLAAGAIDAAPYLIAWLYVSQHVGSTPVTPEEAPYTLYLPILIGLAVYVLHVAISELLFGRSLGKFLFGLRVVAVDGSPAAPGRIVLRNLMRVLDVALGLPFLFVILSPTGQRFGDMAARTLVVADVRGEKPVIHDET